MTDLVDELFNISETAACSDRRISTLTMMAGEALEAKDKEIELLRAALVEIAINTPACPLICEIIDRALARNR